MGIWAEVIRISIHFNNYFEHSRYTEPIAGPGTQRSAELLPPAVHFLVRGNNSKQVSGVNRMLGQEGSSRSCVEVSALRPGEQTQALHPSGMRDGSCLLLATTFP